MEKLKVLNCYSGIGGNRKLWPKECEVTAIENNKEIAKIYQDFFPDDHVIVRDAHQYLLEHYKEFDFIWSSPPCVTHSRLNTLLYARGIERYPDMSLWQEIIFLNQFCKIKWVVENTIPYYDLLVKSKRLIDRHHFWANFNINIMQVKRMFNYNNSSYRNKRPTKDNYNELQKYHGFDLSKYKIKDKIRLLRNCVHPKLGLHIFNCAFKEKQQTL